MLYAWERIMALDTKKSILIIDDETIIRSSFKYYLEDNNFSVMEAENGKEGFQLFKEKHPDIVLTDLRMPEMDGLEVLRKCTEINPDTPVVVISGTGRIQDVVEALRLGAWDYLLKPVENLDVLGHLLQRAMEKMNLLRENRKYQESLENLVLKRTAELERINSQLELSRRQIIGILSQAAEYRDFETGMHFMRVSAISACIARGLGWPKDEVSCIELASPVHDIGKIGIPDHILLKQGPLDDEEWQEMKHHCEYGYSILIGHKNKLAALGRNILDETSGQACSMLEHAANIALNHHEKWDGSGYPSGLKREDIPIQARITAIADTFDAISSKRPYKEAWEEAKCLDYIHEQSGKHFDPVLVDIFFDNIESIRGIKQDYKDD